MNNPSIPPEQEAELLKNYFSAQVPNAGRRLRRGCLTGLFKLLAVGIFGVAVFYGVIAITDPWAFHIGGRSTPLLTWHGYGELQTKDGNRYPLYVSFFPSSHSSQLRLKGLRPVGGLQGRAWLCTSRASAHLLDLSGTIYGRWRTTDGSLITFRLLEWNTARDRLLGNSMRRGFFDLEGRWRGPELLMDERGDHGETGEVFRSGLHIDYASVTLNYGTYSDFTDLCAKYPAH
ncbi:MAG TPA: hypothetical protein VKS44_12510 [Candidatus Acidoferrales bacterium]|nr:hypothetical protein [Candidatus Acidoferrales bacterium]